MAQNNTATTTASEELLEACGADPSHLCRWILEQTDSRGAASWADWLLDRPARILLILLIAIVLTQLVRRAAHAFHATLTDPETSERRHEVHRGPTSRLLLERDSSVRAAARARTLTTVLSSAGRLVIWTIALLMILGEVGISLAPLVAGAGIAGIALGFGAQTVVRDFLAGFFMLLEDQYGIGDVIDVGEVAGTVESMTLRSTSLRDVHGVLWHVPNGGIARVGNKSQLWSRAVIDIEVAHGTDLRLAQGVIQRVADDLWQDDQFEGGNIIAPPEVWGVERLHREGVSIRLVVKTDPAEQWAIGRELRLRISEALVEAGINKAIPQQIIWVRQETAEEPKLPPVAVAEIRRSDPDEILPEDPAVPSG